MGLMWRLEERLRITGTNIEVVAALEAMAETAEVIRQRMRRMTTGGKTDSPASWEPEVENHQHRTKLQLLTEDDIALSLV